MGRAFSSPVVAVLLPQAAGERTRTRRSHHRGAHSYRTENRAPGYPGARSVCS